MSYYFEHFIPYSFSGIKFAFYEVFLKLISGMENSVGPDQIAPLGAVWSGSALFAYAILSDALVYEFFGHLP